MSQPGQPKTAVAEASASGKQVKFDNLFDLAFDSSLNSSKQNMKKSVEVGAAGHLNILQDQGSTFAIKDADQQVDLSKVKLSK